MGIASQSTINEIKAFAEADKEYYRLFVNRDDEPCVVCMQWFDEYDYDQTRFINGKKYETEEQAENALLSLKIKANMPLTNLEKLRIASLLED